MKEKTVKINSDDLEFLKISLTPPVFVCVGTDCVMGDTLGPVTGHLLTRKHNIPCYVYGTLTSPVTAKNIEEYFKYIEIKHPYNPVVVIDAALGKKDDIGKIKVSDTGIIPGSAYKTNKKRYGDYAITAIVSENNDKGKEDFKYVSLNLISDLAETIAENIAGCFTNL